MSYFALKENKSLGETMSKAEIEESITSVNNDIDDLRDSIEVLTNKTGAVAIYRLSKFPSVTDVLKLMSDEYKHQLILIVNDTSNSRTFKIHDYIRFGTNTPVTVFCQKDFSKLVNKVNPVGNISAGFTFTVENLFSLNAGQNCLFQYFNYVQIPES